jgi:hypothetical protein
MSTDVIPFADMERMAATLAKSGLFGIKDPTQAIALMSIAAAEGMHPAKAMQAYHIIDGRPALRADALLARFQAANGSVQWTAYTDQRVAGIFSHPQGGSIEIDWTIERAAQAGLAGRPMWSKYPRQMLRSRCISEGVRAVFPGINAGMYTSEEVADMAADEKALRAEPINVTPEPRVMDDEQIGAHLTAIGSADDLGTLKRAFGTAYSEARRLGDLGAMEQIEAAKNARKALMEAE